MIVIEDRARSIFLAALERAPDQWPAYLDEACTDNAELRARVNELLGAHQAMGTIHGGRVNSHAATIDQFMISEQPGTIIGPYILLQQIGEGGMGVVFMAEQSQPIQRTVAVKIIKPGMDTRQVIARFEAERQALAMMDHPNIAKVLDAGTTDSGRPYFVMELVKGVPITKYSDEKHLPLPARLELFMQVCQAVQHAHQKGVIHRDIKPTNVLVAEYDNHAVPKVIDFGVAKATAQKLTDRTMFTEFGQVLGTVEYMSPEQAKFNQLDIDTRSDVYSLGVLLYELLTGSTPFGRQRLQEAAFDEALRIIREEEPQKPSTRLSTTDELPSIAANRSSEPKKLGGLVKGELDWVVMKALEKDRNRRYETANDLAADVQRYLHDEAVQACSPSATYRFRKFALRNKAALVTAAIVAMSLVLGTAVSIWQAALARRAEALAQTRLESEQAARQQVTAEATKAKTISTLLQQMLGSANPDAARGADYTVRQMLDDFSTKFSEQLQDQPEVEATIRSIIGNAYQRLGELDEAAPHLESALELRRKVFGHDHVEFAKSVVDYARLKSEQGHTREAISLAQEALLIHDNLGTPDEQRIKVLDELALHLWAVGEWDELQPIIDEIRAIAAKNPDKYPERANLLHRIAETTLDPVIGEQYAREAVVLHRRLHGETHPETAWGLQALAKTLRRQGKFAEAERYYQEALAVFRVHYDNSAAPVVLTLANIATVRRFQGDEAGLQELRDEADTLVSLESSDHERWLYAGELHAQLDQWDQAESSFSRLRELSPAYSHYGLRRIAWIRLARKDNRGFKRACVELVRLAQECDDHECWQNAAWVSSIAPDSGVQPMECEALAARALQVDPMDVDNLTTSGAALYRAARLKEARGQLSTAIESAKGNFTYAYFYLAMTEHRLGRIAEGRAYFNRGVTLIDDIKPARKSHVLSEWIEQLALQMLQREAEQELAGARAESN